MRLCLTHHHHHYPFTDYAYHPPSLPHDAAMTNMPAALFPPCLPQDAAQGRRGGRDGKAAAALPPTALARLRLVVVIRKPNKCIITLS